MDASGISELVIDNLSVARLLPAASTPPFGGPSEKHAIASQVFLAHVHRELGPLDLGGNHLASRRFPAFRIPGNHWLSLYPRGFAPSLVALALTARAEGRAGTLVLLRQTVKWSVSARWYVFAIGYMAAIKLTAALLLRITTGAWPAFGCEAVYIMAVAIVFSTPVQAGEEIGWRGYALPRLSASVGLSGASIVLGVIWACWHLPFFFISGTDKSGQSFPVYLLGVTALSVAMAWLYWGTNGSLLLTMLMHAAINNTKDIVPSAVSAATNAFSFRSSQVAWLSVAILWVCAAYFLFRMRGAKLQDGRQAASYMVRAA